jgi:hypothetical protein
LSFCQKIWGGFLHGPEEIEHFACDFCRIDPGCDFGIDLVADPSTSIKGDGLKYGWI